MIGGALLPRLRRFGLRLHRRSGCHGNARLSLEDYDSGQVACDGQRAAFTLAVRQGQVGNELDAPRVVFDRHRYRLQEYVSIGEGCEAKEANAGDPATRVLLTPLPPKYALTEIEHSPVLDDPSRLHQQAVTIHRDLEVRPIGKHDECRTELGDGIIGVDSRRRR